MLATEPVFNIYLLFKNQIKYLYKLNVSHTLKILKRLKNSDTLKFFEKMDIYLFITLFWGPRASVPPLSPLRSLIRVANLFFRKYIIFSNFQKNYNRFRQFLFQEQFQIFK